MLTLLKFFFKEVCCPVQASLVAASLHRKGGQNAIARIEPQVSRLELPQPMPKVSLGAATLKLL